MEEPRPEVAEVFRSFGSEYLAKYRPSGEQRRVLTELSSCRTAALGGHKKRCEDCGHEEFFYNSCRNRHCPKCQGAARAEWLSRRTEELLETPYFHVVFTLPQKLGPIALQNKRLVYGLLFRAVAETLQSIALDPRHLGARIGFLAVLHTWGQKLDHHPHVHCVVPGGGLSPDGRAWIPSRPRFFLAVRVLSRLFRNKFLSYLREAFDAGLLEFHGKLSGLRDSRSWRRFLATFRRSDWVVYSKPPFGGPQQVLKYLARYTHRVAISNQRLIALRDARVTFRYKDYRHGNAQRTMALDAVEFIRRFLQHVLPSGFQRIRYYGLFANRVRTQNIALCRELLDQRTAEAQSVHHSTAPQATALDPCALCPVCKKGRFLLVEELRPKPLLRELLLSPPFLDTS